MTSTGRALEYLQALGVDVWVRRNLPVHCRNCGREGSIKSDLVARLRAGGRLLCTNCGVRDASVETWPSGRSLLRNA